LQVEGQGEQIEHSSSSSSSNDSDPTIANLRNQKTRSLREIYEHNDDVDQQVHVSMLSYQPMYFEEAVKEEKWVDAKNETIEAIERNNTWDLVDLPTGKTNIGVKWMYKTKLNEKGKVEKKNEILATKGFAQQPSIDYGETFSQVVCLDTDRAVLEVACQNKWSIYQMEFKSSFLNGILHEEVYVDQPPGFQIKGKEYKVYRLKKALYGLKQDPRSWYSHIYSYFLKNVFNRSNNEPTLYTKRDQKGNILIICIYVDDMIYTRNLLLNEFNEVMQSEFEMTDLGLMKYFLGIEVEQFEKEIFICQRKYATNILKRFKMNK
jgi:hypothetical protein